MRGQQRPREDVGDGEQAALVFVESDTVALEALHLALQLHHRLVQLCRRQIMVYISICNCRNRREQTRRKGEERSGGREKGG